MTPDEPGRADDRPTMREADLHDCPNCGRFQDWPYSDSVCDHCGYPVEATMRWRREFDATSEPTP